MLVTLRDTRSAHTQTEYRIANPSSANVPKAYGIPTRLNVCHHCRKHHSKKLPLSAVTYAMQGVFMCKPCEDADNAYWNKREKERAAIKYPSTV